MRRYLITAVVMLATAFSVSATDVVITPGGKVFSVEMTLIDERTIPATTAITMSIQDGLEITSDFIPASENGYLNVSPAIAWDEESQTLFAFWLSIRSIASSELLVSSWQNGVWSEPWTIGHGQFHFRSNLEIATTNVVTATNEAGEIEKLPGLRVHAVWWDDDGVRSAARYALLTIEDGEVVSTETAILEDLVAPSEELHVVEGDPYQMHHPRIDRSLQGDSVTIVFADETTRALHGVDITPVAHGVLTIPIGVVDRIPPRRMPDFNAQSAAIAPEIILSEQDDDRMIVWVRDGDLIRYREWIAGDWSEEKLVILNERISVERAISALQRLIDTTRGGGVLTIPIG